MMTTQSEHKSHEHEVVLRDALNAFLTGDMPSFSELLAPDIVWIMPGRSPIAGEHRGKVEVMEMLGRVMALSGGTFRPDVRSLVVDDDGGAYITHDTAERGGSRLDADLVLRVTIRDGKWVKAVEFVHDLYAWDEFWSQP